MFNEPRNWKWMVPSFLIPVMYVIWWSFMMEGWNTLAIIPAGWLLICSVASVINLIIYSYEHIANKIADVKAVTHATPEVRMMEAARGMHPDAVKALLQHRRSIWRIKYIPLKDVVDWIFDEIPVVHAGFVDFFLDHSNGVSVLSKRLLSEGSKQFDPEELFTDYEQYDALISYMQVKLMCTQALGNQSPQWLPPWNVELVRHRFGLDGAPYAVEEEGVSEAMKSVMRAQAQWKEKGLKDLGSTAQNAFGSQQLSVNGNGKKPEQPVIKPVIEEKPLSDEEWDAIQTEIVQYSNQSNGLNLKGDQP